MTLRYLVDTDWAIHSYELTVLTNNRRHFERIEGLIIESL